MLGLVLCSVGGWLVLCLVLATWLCSASTLIVVLFSVVSSKRVALSWLNLLSVFHFQNRSNLLGKNINIISACDNPLCRMSQFTSV